MRIPGPSAKHASMVWLEPHRVHAGGQAHRRSGPPEATEELVRLLAALPPGPTQWVVDDAWIPSLLLRDIVEVPAGLVLRVRANRQLGAGGAKIRSRRARRVEAGAGGRGPGMKIPRSREILGQKH